MKTTLLHLQELLTNPSLTTRTKQAGIADGLKTLQQQTLALREVLFDLYAGLHEGFTDHDETGVEFCPLCDHARNKGHAETCPWVKLENLLGEG